MKKYLCLLLLGFFWQPASANDTQEAKLLKDFLQAIYAQREQDPKALEYLQKTLQNEPDSKYLKRIIVMQALAENNLEAAEPYADFATQGENDAEDWTTYGAYLWKKGRFEEAQEAYQKAIALDPEDMNQWYSYLMLLSATDLNKAVQTLEELAERYPSMKAAAYTEAGNLFLRRNRLQEAMTYFEKALQANPEEVGGRLGKADVYERSSQFFLMLHELEELENRGFGNTATYSRMASVYLLGKDFKKAEQYFLKAVALQPDDPPSCYFLALLSEQKGDFEKAASYLQQAGDYETNPAKWLQVSFYQQKLNQFEQSTATLAKAHEKFPDNVEITFFYGLALQQLDQPKKAAQIFKQLVEKRPEYTEAWLQYAYSLESLKKYQEMEHAIQQVLSLQANHAPALNLFAYSLAQRGIRLEEAQQYIARALAINPNDVAFIDTQAWIYFKQGNVEGALSLLRALPKEVVLNNPEIAYHLGAILAAQNKKEEALPYLEKAQDSLPEAKKLYRRLLKRS